MLFDSTTNKGAQTPIETTRVFLPIMCVSLGNMLTYESKKVYDNAPPGVPKAYDSVCLRGVRETYQYGYLYVFLLFTMLRLCAVLSRHYQNIRFRYHCGDWQINMKRIAGHETTFFFTEKRNSVRIPFIVEISNDVGKEQYGNPALSTVNWKLSAPIQ